MNSNSNSKINQIILKDKINKKKPNRIQWKKKKMEDGI
jgi:hypothetical protein